MEYDTLYPLYQQYITDVTMMSTEEKKELVEAIIKRIDKFKLQGVMASNVLIDGARRGIVNQLQTIVTTLETTPVDPALKALEAAAEAAKAKLASENKASIDKIKKANPFLTLFRIAWFMAHPDKIEDTALSGWTKMLESIEKQPTVQALLDRLNTPNPKVQSPLNYFKGLDVRTAIEKDNISLAELDAEKQLTKYTEKEAKEALIQARIEEILGMLVTVGFIQKDKKDKGKQFREIVSEKDVAGFKTYSDKIKDNIKRRLNNAMTVVNDYYKTLYPELYKVVDSIVAGIASPDITKLLKFQDAIITMPKTEGLYALNKDTSALLLPWIKAYKENTQTGTGTLPSALSSASIGLNPLPPYRIWFFRVADIKQLPSDASSMTKLTPPPAIIAPATQATPEDIKKQQDFVKTAYDAMKKFFSDSDVLMIVQSNDPAKQDIDANLSIFGEANTPGLKDYNDWKLSVPQQTVVTLSKLGITIPTFDTDTCLSNHVLQLCTLIAFQKQIDSA